VKVSLTFPDLPSDGPATFTVLATVTAPLAGQTRTYPIEVSREPGARFA
jgi:hypothetical protein